MATGVTPRALAPGSYRSQIARRRADSRRSRSRTAKSGQQRHLPGMADRRPPRVRRSAQPAPTAGSRPRPGSDASAASRRYTWCAVAPCSSTPYAAREIREWMTVAESNGRSAIVRNIDVAASAEPLWLMLGFSPRPDRRRSVAGRRRAWPSSPSQRAAHRAHCVDGQDPEPHRAGAAGVAMSDGALAENVAFQPAAGQRRGVGRKKSRPLLRGRPPRTPTSWTTSRCRSTILAPQGAPERHSVPRGTAPVSA